MSWARNTWQTLSAVPTDGHCCWSGRCDKRKTTENKTLNIYGRSAKCSRVRRWKGKNCAIDAYCIVTPIEQWWNMYIVIITCNCDGSVRKCIPYGRRFKLEFFEMPFGRRGENEALKCIEIYSFILKISENMNLSWWISPKNMRFQIVLFLFVEMHFILLCGWAIDRAPCIVSTESREQDICTLSARVHLNARRNLCDVMAFEIIAARHTDYILLCDKYACARVMRSFECNKMHCVLSVCCWAWPHTIQPNVQLIGQIFLVEFCIFLVLMCDTIGVNLDCYRYNGVGLAKNMENFTFL